MRVVLFAVVLVAACRSCPYEPKGGYRYPSIVSKESEWRYFYPLKDSLSVRDQLYDRYAFIPFAACDEPNLSVRPQPQPTIRLSYFDAFGKMVLVTITPQQVVIKRGQINDLYAEDTSRLNAIENIHFNILRHNYPLNDPRRRRSDKFIKRVDSLVALYPQLLDSNYYFYLYEKVCSQMHNKLPYKTNAFSITINQFANLLKQIDNAGYWQLPFTIKCEAPPADGYEYYVEVNTPTRYNVVYESACGVMTKFATIAQDIANFAGVGDDIDVIFGDTPDSPANY